jgi:DNA-binding transcriptional regulator YhcF (GntR family)
MNTIWTPVLPEGEGPKYLALTRALREAIRAGVLPEGAQLPTVRDLAWRISVTPGTVSRAYQIATQEGLLETIRKRPAHVQLGRQLLQFLDQHVIARLFMAALHPAKGNVAQVLHPFEIGHGHPARIGEQIRDDDHAARGKGLIRFGSHGAIRRLKDQPCADRSLSGAVGGARGRGEVVRRR